MSLKETNINNRRPRANTDPMDSPIGRGESASSGSFVTKLYKMVDSEPPTIVSWIRNGTAFCIVDPKMMAEHCLPKYFRHRRFSSLIRQLNFYSFYRVQEGQLTIYQHSFFRKGRPDLLSHIKRRGAGKAKDPWFDPLSVVQKPPVPMMSMNPLMITATQPMEPSQRSNVMTCYSPMAKPLASSMENMSPALKPGMAHVIPPIVELNGGQEDQPWGQELMEEDEILIKPETMYSQEMKPMITANINVMDIDIQDFLTDDCSIHASMTDKNTRPMEEREHYGSAVMMKRSLVARNCLKWGEKDMEASDTVNSECTNGNEEDTFEQELLSDLANNVDSNAWEVPLSPLNEEEDVMPWLDLCF